MKVPKGQTFYIGKKKLKAGDEIPPALESKFSKPSEKDKKPNNPPPVNPGDKDKRDK